MKLTNKQKRFALEYVQDYNGKQAAIRAGYSPKCAKVQASRLLTYTNVRSEIDTKIAEISKKLDINVEWVVKELVKLKETAKNEGVKLGAIEFLGRWQGMHKDKGDGPQVIIMQADDIKRKKP